MIGDLSADDSKLCIRRRQRELEPVNGRIGWSETKANEKHAFY
jgi:hypothetical protein